MSIATALTALATDIDAAKAAITAKGGTAPNGTADMADSITAIPSGGITPTGSVTLTEENTYDVTDKAQAVVDFSATRANLAEAVTAKGVDTLPTSSFDTIATNIGLIDGGGGLPSADYTTTTAFNSILALVADIKLQTGFIDCIIVSAESAPAGGYWLYYNVHIEQDTDAANVVYRRTGSGTIGLSTTASTATIAAGLHYKVYSLDDYFN